MRKSTPLYFIGITLSCLLFVGCEKAQSPGDMPPGDTPPGEEILIPTLGENIRGDILIPTLGEGLASMNAILIPTLGGE